MAKKKAAKTDPQVQLDDHEQRISRLEHGQRPGREELDKRDEAKKEDND